MPVSHSRSSSTAGTSSKVAFATNLTTTIPTPPTPSSLNSNTSNSSHIGHKKRSSGSEVFVSENSHMKRSISTPAMASAAMISSEQLADFERQRQGQMMMTTYISSAIREKKQVCSLSSFLLGESNPHTTLALFLSHLFKLLVIEWICLRILHKMNGADDKEAHMDVAF